MTSAIESPQYYVEAGTDTAGHGWIGVLPKLDPELLSEIRQLRFIPGTEILAVGPSSEPEKPHSELVIFCVSKSADCEAITLKYAMAVSKIIESAGVSVAVDEAIRDFSVTEGLFEGPWYDDKVNLDNAKTNTMPEIYVPAQTLSNDKEATPAELEVKLDDPRLFNKINLQGESLMLPKLLTVREAADFLGFGTPKVRRLIDERTIDHVILPGTERPEYRVPATYIAGALTDNAPALEEFYRFCEHKGSKHS